MRVLRIFMSEQVLVLENSGKASLRKLVLKEGKAKDWRRKVGETIQVGAVIVQSLEVGGS